MATSQERPLIPPPKKSVWFTGTRPHRNSTSQDLTGTPPNQFADLLKPEFKKQVGGAAKKQKVEKAAVPETTADWLQCWQDRLLDKQTVPVLKEFCKSRELPVGGKKDDLVKRVHAKLEEIAAEEVNAVGAEGANAAKPEEVKPET